MKWNVYEMDGHDRNYIGHIEAGKRSEAIQSARRKYGAPIEVRLD